MKIVYFDYWTEGVINFIPFDSQLGKRGHETILLHIGSYNSPQKKEEVVKGIKCRDVSFYKTNMIYKMLKQEKPDVVVSLNTTKILDRVVVLSCRKLDIKSIYLMHGIRDLGDANNQLISLMERSYNSFFKKIQKAGKYFSIIIPNYLYTLSKYKARNIINLKFFRVIYSYFKNPGKAFYFPEYREELLHDLCLVYSKSEGKYYERFGYSKPNIKVVGNPKYDSLCNMILNNKFTIDMLPKKVQSLVKEGNKYALLLEESFPEQNNTGGFTLEARDRFIMECAERLKKENLKLVVKLHPTTNAKNINANHENCLIEKNHLDPLIYFCEFAICYMSTTINNCVLMNKPVLIPLWFSNINLPTFFADVGISNAWQNKDDKLNISINKSARERYINDYITVVSPDAVNNVVAAIIN